MRATVLVGAALAIAFNAGCRRGTDPDATDPIDQAQGALDFSTGNVQGTLVWNGAPAEPQSYFLYEAGVVRTGLTDSSYALPDLATGAHTIDVIDAGCFGFPTNQMGEVTFDLAPGTTTVDIDLTATAGRIKGSISVNGSPFPDASVNMTPDAGGCAALASTGADGTFSRLVRPGSYTATVQGAAGSMMGSFTFTVDAGATVDLGEVALSTASVQGTLVWNGAPAEPQSYFLYEAGVVRTGFSDSSYALPNLATGAHTIDVIDAGCFGFPTNQMGEVTFDLAPGTTNVDIDLTATAGRIKGSISVNGSPFPDASVNMTPDAGCAALASTGADGTFSRLVRPGSYTATVQGPAGDMMGSFTFAVDAGATIDLGEIALSTASAQGTLMWNGAPVEPQSYFLYEAGAVRAAFSGSSYALPNLAAGSHTIDVIDAGCFGFPTNQMGEVTFDLAPGTTADVDIDLTATAGRIKGSISVNGAAFPEASVNMTPDAGGCAAPASTGADGTFSRLVRPGSYTADVEGPGGSVGSFSFTVLAGQTTDVDSVSTPAQANLQLNLLGGLAKPDGLSLLFSNVTAAGSTSVVVSGSCVPSCSPPPTGYAVVGARYWDIATTATYAGPITVCLAYDPQDVCGTGISSCAKESTLRLVHDAGSGFVNITNGPVDTVNKRICGVTTSLSPFAVVVPVEPPNTPPPPDTTPPVFGAPPAPIVAKATSTAGAVVGYDPPQAIDAVDGERPVDCAPAPGTTFPPGQTQVTCTASDTSGNTSSTTFSVWVQYDAPADGSFFLKPINPDGSSVFKLGSTVPVKFKLTGASAGIKNLVAHLAVAKVSNGVAGSYAAAESTATCDANSFRYDPADKVYIFNLATRKLAAGTWSLRADLGDLVPHTISVSLK